MLRQQIEAGLVKDITADLQPWRDTLVPTSFEAYQFDGKTEGAVTTTMRERS